MPYIESLVYLIPLLFIAGVLDSIAGGGGLIALPAYMLTGMPIHSAYACNKLQSAAGSATAGAKFIKEGYIDIRIALIALPFTVLASYFATRIVIALNSDTVKLIIAACIPIAVLLMFLKRKITTKTVLRQELNVKTISLSIASGLVLGSYDALFGPGGGTIAMIIFSLLLNYDLRVGNANSKLIIMTSNITAAISYALQGFMLFHIAIPCAIANMLGSYIGSSIAIKKGDKIVLPTMLTVLVFLVGQVVLGFIV